MAVGVVRGKGSLKKKKKRKQDKKSRWYITQLCVRSGKEGRLEIGSVIGTRDLMAGSFAAGVADRDVVLGGRWI